VHDRHLILSLQQYCQLETWGDANRASFDAAEELGYESLLRALTRGGVEPGNIAALMFMSITGVSGSSIGARLIDRMSLPTGVRRVPVFGLGCASGGAGICTAADYARAYPKHVAALVSVEPCSLTPHERLRRDIDSFLANTDFAVAMFRAGSCTRADQRFWRLRKTRLALAQMLSLHRGSACVRWETFPQLPSCSSWNTS
jgi:predicted naringenin-chalcone synthase